MRRPTFAELRAGLWALRAGAGCHRQLSAGRLEDVELPSAASITVSGTAGVHAAARMLRFNCLTRALVTQAWQADHGHPADVVIGVTAPATGFAAHAWLDDGRGGRKRAFEEIHRLPAPRR